MTKWKLFKTHQPDQLCLLESNEKVTAALDEDGSWVTFDNKQLDEKVIGWKELDIVSIDDLK